MSSSEMYRHLNLLQEVVPVRHDIYSIGPRLTRPQEDMRTPLEIETILFRVSAILQGDKRLVFGIRDGTLPLIVPRLKGSRTQELPGIVGYNAYVADSAEEGTSSQILSTQPKPRPRSSFNPPGCIGTQLCGARRAIHRGIKSLGPLGPPPTYYRQDVCLDKQRVRSVF